MRFFAPSVIGGLLLYGAAICFVEPVDGQFSPPQNHAPSLRVPINLPPVPPPPPYIVPAPIVQPPFFSAPQNYPSLRAPINRPANGPTVPTSPNRPMATSVPKVLPQASQNSARQDAKNAIQKDFPSGAKPAPQTKLSGLVEKQLPQGSRASSERDSANALGTTGNKLDLIKESMRLVHGHPNAVDSAKALWSLRNAAIICPLVVAEPLMILPCSYEMGNAAGRLSNIIVRLNSNAQPQRPNGPLERLLP